MSEFDFNEWSELYKSDPEGFEKKRLEVLNDFIEKNSKDEESKRKMQQTLFKLNATIQTSKNHLESCMKCFNMMWDSFEELDAELNNKPKKKLLGKTGKVLNFNKDQNESQNR